MASTLCVPDSSSIPLLRQLLFQFLDRLEEIAEFFNADQSFVGPEFQQPGVFLFQAFFDFVPGNRS